MLGLEGPGSIGTPASPSDAYFDWLIDSHFQRNVLATEELRRDINSHS